ncbi:uncharacterized protein LOC111712920 [Eurytemora carolleeae]|uniref:uncharacterized protein LOC111712920 n=1 Tax=Eurytemora carolleeae TaxID=1294199 RepID=UPI000C76B96C|nr:uncharacterized protein LOC111712920 [Eurytemora carolleeae]|eukprot:XP_023343449.1 uncharacterized protein LOC111712920 [Eurytemora affinis]
MLRSAQQQKLIKVALIFFILSVLYFCLKIKTKVPVLDTLIPESDLQQLPESDLQQLPESNQQHIPKNNSVQKLVVNEIRGEDLPEIKPFACVRSGPFPPNDLTLMMCIKELKVDEFISKPIFETGVFERPEVELILKLIKNYPDGTLLDIGSNIGVFSVTAAATNYRVVSVDPFKTNLAYTRMSTVLQGTQDNVRYIANTVSDKKYTLYPWYRYPNNEGGITFLTEEETKNKPNLNIGEGVESVKFVDLLDAVHTQTVVVKIDIEGHECRTFIQYLNEPKKTKKFVPYILMEWVHITHNRDNMCPNIQILIQGFLDGGYFPVDLDSLKRLRIENEKSWYNVLWVHQDAIL